MKNHTRIYFEFFGYDESDWIMCEIPGCGNQAVDIAHIDARGMGGDPQGKKDVIENLMAKCRLCHIKYGDLPEFFEFLYSVHRKVMESFKPLFKRITE
jgi:hypothetical protein